MAITRTQKEGTIAQLKELFSESKLTLVVNYQGVSVAQFQALRSLTNEGGVIVRVVKNRLVRQTLKDLKLEVQDLDLQGMLVYVFSPSDEVKGAQILRSFIKSSQAPLEFVGAITEAGDWMDKTEVIKLASLSSKPELIARAILMLQTPIQQLQNSLGGGLPAILSALKANKS